MKTISVITPCYNEEENVLELYEQVKRVLRSHPNYLYEHIFIDNSSTDSTVAVLKGIASNDRNVRIIVNSRNFGPVRSHPYAMFQASGDAVVMMACDLQDPPELIHEFIRLWEQGNPMVLAVKEQSEENSLMFGVRKSYYRLMNYLSSIQTIENFTGFGLYDRKVVDIVRSFGDPNPYFRGIIAEIGLPHAEVPFVQPLRRRGVSKFSTFYRLYDVAMNAVTNLSKVPLRFVTFFGFVSSAVSLLIGLFYFIYKIVYWYNFTTGMAPIVIGLFFFGSVQMLALGIIGEYLGSVHTFVQKRPLVIERERMNFEFPISADGSGSSAAGATEPPAARRD